MRIERNSIVFLSILLILVGMGFFLLAWPRYRRAADLNRQIELVKTRVANENDEIVILEAIAGQLKFRQDIVKNDLRNIPTNTDMAKLITALTVSVDGFTVLDQTFNRGRIRAIPTVEDGSLYSLPLIIEMTSTFDRVYELVMAVEAMPDLVRVTSVRIERHAKIENMVQSTINLDAIFEIEPGETIAQGVGDIRR